MQFPRAEVKWTCLSVSMWLWPVLCPKDDNTRWATLRIFLPDGQTCHQNARGLTMWRHHGSWPPHTYQKLSLLSLRGGFELWELQVTLGSIDKSHPVILWLGFCLSHCVCELLVAQATLCKLRAFTVIPSPGESPYSLSWHQIVLWAIPFLCGE